MRRSRLVYVLHDFQLGGVEVALLSAIPILCANYELTVIVLGKIDSSFLLPLTDKEKQVFKSFDFPIFTYPLKIQKIVTYIINRAPDILICSLWRASWIGMNVKRELPSVKFLSFIHSNQFFHKADAFFSTKAISMADAVLVDSSSTLCFVKGLASKDISLRTVSFLTHSTPLGNPSGRKAVSFSERDIRFLFMGSLSKVKNIPMIVNFIGDVRARGHSVVLDIYGRKGNDLAQVEHQIRALKLEDYVNYKGEVHPSDRMRIFLEYDFYIQQSEFEGMAMSVAEAMQNGLVCVVTPVGEIPSYATDGDSAIFMNYNDERSRLAAIERIEEMISHPQLYNNMSNKCHDVFLNAETYAESLIKNLF